MHGDEGSATQTIRGAVSDRPWGLTLGALGTAARSVLLTLRSDQKVFRIVFDRGVVIAASSPVPADSVARIALTSHLITPAQINDIKRRIAAAPGADEVDVLAEAAGLSSEQARALRQRLVTQRAARTFSALRGEYEVAERAPLPAAQGPTGVDVRIIIYMGARTNLTELRLGLDLRQLGTRFALKPDALRELPRYGFTRTERPVLEALRRGTSLQELEANQRELDPRVAQSVIYALASCDALMPAESLASGSGVSLPLVARTEAPPPPSRAPTATGGLPLRPPAPPLPPRAKPRTLPPRSLLDTFRTNRITAVRPNALAAHEVVTLIEQRTALLDRGADHFTLLGIAIGAPVEDVHAAYVELSRNLRPARLAELGISDEGFAAQRLLAQLGIAYTVLTDRILRAEYLASLRGADRRPAAGPP
jgi:hypothetical protein